MADEVIADGGRAYTLGPLIHNPQVVADLAARGAEAVSSVEEIRWEGAAAAGAPADGVVPKMCIRDRLKEYFTIIPVASCIRHSAFCKSARRIARLSKATAKARWVMSTEVAMVTWTQLLTFVLVIIAVIDLTVRARK